MPIKSLTKINKTHLGKKKTNLEEMAGIKEGVKVAKAKVGSGAMAAEGVKVPAANENELGDPKGGGAPSQSAYVVSLGYVMHHHVALYHHFPFCFFNFYSILLVIPNALN